MQRTTKIIILISIGFLSPLKALALPAPEDIPEEVLRAEIITSARSPLDNQPLNAAEYALLEEQLATSIYPPQITPKIRQLIALRRLQKLLQIFIPFYR
ncbi:MAG: glutathione S-transferase [Microcystis sp. M_OC_Ca_00000000_S217Cul]|uniref:glutathione S-transferase n=1 Tax=unclassified Microcystis TaxID=2643300 RepID=UPI00118FDA73|nr:MULTISPECIES: glutathione S-transferase [unclassified Microcystis]TRT81058.1 MAG: glutathione S-transferase [Microcystis sp. M_OC_Ca_00000000_S217Cul]TRT92405.1 MAG: glutathione S-transferase [Microcystis sp. M_OC_Ca_00000000_C217Col]